MSLTNVWIQTQADGLVRADQISGIDAHPTPALAGKPSHWLLDLVLPAPTGSGTAGEGAWAVGPTHLTVIQTPDHPGDAPAALARLLAQLDPVGAAGTITAEIADQPTHPGSTGPSSAASTGSGAPGDTAVTATASRVRFQFRPFPRPPAASHDTESHYL